MLDTLTAADFLPRIGQTCQLLAEGHQIQTLTVQSVSENSRIKPPEGMRTPFSVIFIGPTESDYSYGVVTLEFSDWTLAGVGFNRIMPPWGADPSLAYYQLVFN